jgi:hypothetical protein
MRIPDERGGRTDDVLDPAEVAALVDGLRDADVDLRIVMFEALTRLPLHPRTWAEVEAYVAAALSIPERVDESLAVIGATPALPMPWLDEQVARLAEVGPDEVRTAAAEAMARTAAVRGRAPAVADSALSPWWAGGEPPGFAVGADLDRARATLGQIDLAGDASPPYFRLDEQSRTTARVFAAGAATVLFERAAATRDILLANDVVLWVHELERSFRPDLHGLFAIYRSEAAAEWAEWRRQWPDERLFPRFFDPGLEAFRRWLCWQIGWTVSRGGLRPLLAALEPRLAASADAEGRLAAACLIADAADYSTEAQAPRFGGGFGPERRVNVSVVATAETPAAPATADEDVQFSVYRPRLVRPGRWYPLLVFAHRTTAFKDEDGKVVDPIASVERQAQALLSDQAVPFDALTTDSPALERGTELRFQPWLEGGEVNPDWAPLRWEEPIHRVEFRLRALASAEGARLRGGLRVFRSGLLIGEVTFYVSVSATAPVTGPPTDRLAVKRYRKIFASYSHKDSDVVQLVTDYVETTGDEYLIDVRNLRSGQQWERRLEELITQADLFQLFWSRNSMASEFVRREWEYALGLGREDFIRPVYWQRPMPADEAQGLPPESLVRLQFSQLPLRPVVIPPVQSVEDRTVPPALSIERPRRAPSYEPDPTASRETLVCGSYSTMWLIVVAVALIAAVAFIVSRVL